LLVNLSTVAKSFGEGWGGSTIDILEKKPWKDLMDLRRNNHELLESQAATSVGSIKCQLLVANSGDAHTLR